MHSPTKPLKIALVGCGQIADAHLAQVRRVRSAQTVAVCDVYEDLAWQAAKRFDVPGIYTDIDTMLADAKPDVVHVTTPAHTHASLTKKLLHDGCHVYVEKPFTLDAAEADEVIIAASLAGKSICLGHDQLFDPAWLQCRKLVASGAIGKVRHVESILGYPISGSFGSLVAGDPNHSVRRLPGGLFQNTISHPLYRITDFLLDESPTLIGGWQNHPIYDFPTELHLTMLGETVTGTLTFATNLPPQRITRVYGSRGTLEVDLDTQVVRTLKLTKLPGAFAKLEGPLQQWTDSTRTLFRNLWRFAKADIHYFGGMKNLFEAYYQSLMTGSEPPIPYTEMRRVTAIMDQIFDHCKRQDVLHSARPARKQIAREVICP